MSTFTDRRRQNRIERLYDAARDIVCEEGLDALTMQALASRVDKSAPALYRYVDSRDALLSELCVRAIESLGASLEGAVRAMPDGERDGEPLFVLATLVLASIRWTQESQGEFALVRAMLADPRPLLEGEPAERIFPVAYAHAVGFAEAMDRAFTQGEFGPGNRFDQVLILLSALQGVLEKRKLERFEHEIADTARLAGDCARALFVGWGAPAASVAQAFEQAQVRSDAQTSTSTSH